MCNREPLLNFNVFKSQPTVDEEVDPPETNPQSVSFLLNRNCAQFTDVFSQYCLIPPVSRLASTTTCNIALNNENVSFLFSLILQGVITELNHLPALYCSAAQRTDEETKNLIWFPRTDLIASEVLNSAATDYRGFRPVRDITRFAVSNIGNAKALCFGPSNDTPGNFILQLFRLDNLGFFRAQQSSLSTGQLLPMTVNPNLGQRYDCYVNDDGSLMFALLGLNLFQFNPSTNIWSALPFFEIINVLLDNNVVVIVQSSVLVFYAPGPPQTLGPFANEVIWACFTKNKQHILVCVPQFFIPPLFTTFVCQIHLVSMSTRSILSTWTSVLPGESAAFSSYQYSAVAMNSFDGMNPIVFLMTCVNNNEQPSPLRISLPPNSPNAFYGPNPQPTFVIPRFFNNNAWFQTDDNKVHIPNGVNLIDGQSFAITNIINNQLISNITPLAASADGANLWVFVSGQLWRMQILPPSPPPLLWSNRMNVYMEFNARVNDEYEFTVPLFVEVWYLGRTSFTVQTQLVVNSVVATSRHTRFRVVVTKISQIDSANTPTFPYTETRIDQMNDYFALTSFTTRFYENANIDAKNEDDNLIVFKSNTPDESSDPSTFKVFDMTTMDTLVTGNGLYIMYHDNATKTVRVVYNVFNSASFAQWCKQDEEYVARALEAQSEFCFRNLRTRDTTTVTFSDSRCSCIGGIRLFQMLFPDFAALERETSGRLLANLPCVLGDCGKTFLQGPEKTNVYEFVQEHCKQDVSICSDIVSTTGNPTFKNVDFFIQQNCGKNTTSCRSNAECPIGTVCIDGNCVMTCTTDQACKNSFRDPFATCDPKTGRCLYSSQAVTNRAQTKRTSIIVIVVLLGLMFVFLFLLLGFFVKSKN